MKDSFINIREERDVAVVELNRGITNAISKHLVSALSNALNTLSNDPNLKGLVITSSNDKFFSIGLDIPQLYDLSIDEFREFYQSFNQLCLDLISFQKPIIAVITGHAIAGGFILALCCDYRYIADGRKLVGLNEIKLGVPVPYIADCILRTMVGYRYARDVMETGKFYDPLSSLELGLVDQVVPIEKVLPFAIEKVRHLSAHSIEAYSLIKKNRVELILSEINEGLNDREARFIECWYSENTRVLLKGAMAKF